MVSSKKLKVAILGTGKIGTDLLIKITNSNLLECTMFAGRNLESAGMKKARELGIAVSDKGISAIMANKNRIDIVFDATSADHHLAHAPLLAEAGIKVIDMTPAKIGESCIPCLTGNLLDRYDNINMVTCGGQATIPIFNALSKVIDGARNIKVNTQVTPDSVGQATFDNIDNYYSTTAAGIKRFSGFTPDTIILAVDDSPTRDAMTSEITLTLDHCDIDAVNSVISKRVLEMQAYVPGYNLVAPASFSHGILSLTIRVIGDGSWIPPHAGNLDIINCAAIAAAEDFAAAMVVSKPANTFSPYTLVKEWFRPGNRWGSQA